MLDLGFGIECVARPMQSIEDAGRAAFRAAGDRRGAVARMLKAGATADQVETDLYDAYCLEMASRICRAVGGAPSQVKTTIRQLLPPPELDCPDGKGFGFVKGDPTETRQDREERIAAEKQERA